ncbi:MAG: CoA-binding protein, partial [Candidatus Helarchaeota archaeon]
MKFNNLKAFFYPKSIAIIGASTKPFKFGGMFLKALLDYGYSGKIFPVNANAAARGEIIQGLKAWNLEDITDPIDLVYITVPAQQVPDELRKCAQKNFKSIVILTAGFKETGKEGKELEDLCVRIAKRYNLRVIGPNCFGVYHPKGETTLLPGGDFPKEPGEIGVLSQSGGNSVNFVLLGQTAKMKFSKVISYGNAMDLDLPDFIDCFNEDEDTKVIAAYVEGVREITKLRTSVKKLRKPLVMWKSGLTEDGARAAASHTGFLSGQAEIWKGFFNQNRRKILAVSNFEELFDTTKILAFLPPLDRGNYKECIGVIGGGGGIGIEISDVANYYGLKIPKLSEEVKKKLRDHLPLEGTSINNPLDMGNPTFIGDYKKILDIFMGDPNIKILINDLIVDFVLDLKLVFRIIRDYQKVHQHPIIIILRQLLK